MRQNRDFIRRQKSTRDYCRKLDNTGNLVTLFFWMSCRTRVEWEDLTYDLQNLKQVYQINQIEEG